jgi:membrane-associated phospholipid phosphatase
MNRKRDLLMQYRCILPLLLVVMPGVSALFAQDPDTAVAVQENRYNFAQFGRETVDFFIQPIRWDGNDWLKLGAIGAGTLALMQFDQPIRNEVTKDQRYYKSVPIEAGRMWAELPPPVLIFAGLATYSLITGDMAIRKTAYELGQALLYAGAVDKLSNIAIGRAKPYMNEGPKSFYSFSASSFSFQQDHQSLPGGHCVIAFAMSTVLSRNAGPLWLKVAAFVPAGLTFVSRVYQDRHWTSDDFLGAALGYFVATWVVDQHERVERRIQISSVFPLTISVTLN